MIAAALLALALGQQPVRNLEAEARAHGCADPQAQVEMNFCAEIGFERADIALNRAYQSAIADARRMDQEIDRTSDRRPTAEAELREAQRAWVAFRDAHCTWDGYQEARGGSMEPMIYNGCRALLTQARTAQLTGGEDQLTGNQDHAH